MFDREKSVLFKKCTYEISIVPGYPIQLQFVDFRSAEEKLGDKRMIKGFNMQKDL